MVATTMALIPHQRNKSMARRCIRPSLDLRAAAQEAPVKTQVQGSSLNRKSPISSNATNEIGSNSDSIPHHHHHTRQVALSQRSSLRRALRESLDLLDESIRSTESIGSSIATTLPRRPQRNSLRRAIRDSLAAAIDTCGGGGSRVSRANNSKSKSAQSLLPGPIAAKELDFETRRQETNDRNGGKTCTRHSSNPKARAMSHAISQRSSLRRAIRESRNATVQSIEPVDTTSHGAKTLTDTIHGPLSSSDGENGSVISPLGSSPTIVSNTSKPLPEEGILKTPTQINHTSCIVPHTTYGAPLTAMACRPLAISPSQEGLMPETSLLAEPPTSRPLLPTSRSFLNHVLAPKVNNESTWLKSTRYQNPHLASVEDRGIRDNERHLDNPSDCPSMPNQKGWHYVREIISEAPGGLFLVEWEERDARTGSKWPASWVKAKDISMCAIQDWERKK